jgi:L-alanine-DL-glutamate epimerase-like enolase superfamily enzyme
LETDITLSIAAPDAMVRRARFFWSIGFRSFKVKVGRDSIRDVECLAAVDVALPQAAFRLDANAGFDPASALALLDELARRGIEVELFEQPCGAHDVAGMAEVARAAGVPVIADESVRSVHDVDRLAEAGAAHGVNLKLAKHGGLLRAVAIGQRAQERGMRVMVGGMVETRLGMTAMAHVAVALGGVDYVDLDTAWLLEDDPFEGGYEADGPRYRVSTAPGLGVRRRGPAKVR